jgi:RNA polymerase sigma-70 factor, ECF subfamily
VSRDWLHFTMKDISAIQRIQKGDIKAYEQLFRKYYEQLCQWAHQYLHDRDSSEEVVQELFYYIWLKREGLDFRVSVKSYLYKSISNNCKMILRQKKRRSEIESILASDAELSTDPENLLESEEINDIVNRTLINLPERSASVFKMSRFEGMKYTEIAEKLNISVKTVEANMSKALALFRQNLEKYING